MGVDIFGSELLEVSITFKPERQRQPITGIMTRAQHRRLVRDNDADKQTGTYAMILDKLEVYLTFPVSEIDTITAVRGGASDEQSGNN
jgi:hypothetical protein